MVLWEDSHSKKITTKMHYEKVRGKNESKVAKYE